MMERDDVQKVIEDAYAVRYAAILSKLQVYDLAVDQLKLLHEKFDDLLAFQKEHALVFQKHVKCQEDLSHSSRLKHEDVLEKLEEHDQIITRHASFYCEVQKSLEQLGSDFVSGIDKISRKTQESLQDFARKGDVDSFVSSVSVSLSKLGAAVASQADSLQKVVQELKELKLAKGVLEHRLEVYDRQLFLLSEGALQEKEAFEKKLAESRKDLQSQCISVKSEAKKDLDLLRQEIAESPSNAESVKKDIELLLSEMNINLKNYQLRVANVDKQLFLMQKQIENVNLLLKKHELDA